MPKINPPPDLLALQRWFSEIETLPIDQSGPYEIPLYGPSLKKAIAKQIADGPHLKGEQRIGIYNQQYWWRLYKTLQNHYPALLRLFGYEAFNNEIAKPYLTQYPPNDWSLHKLGADLPSWLSQNYTDSDASFVHSIAEIDAAYQELSYVQKRPFSGKIPKILHLQPTVKLFHLKADLFSFRKALLEHDPSYWEDHDFPSISKSAQFFVLFRDGEIHYEEISHTKYTLLKSFQNGSALSSALSLLSPNEYPISEWFQKWSSREWLRY